MKEKKQGGIILLLSIILGAFSGLVIWCFLKAVAVCTDYVWEKLPEMTGFSYLPLILCTTGGLIAGIIHKKYGEYPEELAIVAAKIKKDKYYDYRNIGAMLFSAFIPLVCGASVGPEAGLTGIIAALCYWVGDNVSYAKKNAKVFSELGEAVTLGQLFRSPLFGILAVEEVKAGEDDEVRESLQRGEKLLYYGLSTAAGFFAIKALDHIFGKAMEGFPSFDSVSLLSADYVLIVLYVSVGVLLFLFYEKSEALIKKLSAVVPVIAKESFCGFLTGIVSLFLPIVLFSGEEEMANLMQKPGALAPLFLVAVCLIKMIMTAFCICFGMKGGHFFPVIFACTLMGYGLSGFIFPGQTEHAVFAAGIIAAAMLGAQLRKPLTVAVLLLLCFPVSIIFWLFLSAAAGSFAATRMGRGREDSLKDSSLRSE